MNRPAPEGEAAPPPSAAPQTVFRHRLSTRVWHWVNAITIFVMLMSGLMIFNAHPHLYWGQYGANLDKPWLSLPRFPGWATIPSTYDLALGRHWHLAFAWVLAFGLLAYLLWSLFNGHLKRNVALSRAEVAPAHLWEDIKKHARFDFTESEARYNPLQKITYSLVLAFASPCQTIRRQGMIITRRNILVGSAAGLLAGCDALGRNEDFRKLLALGEKGNFAIQRSLQDRMALAKEFRPEQRSPVFRVNGTHQPKGDAYATHMQEKFVNWRLTIDGLVARPQSYSVAQLMAGPKRSQITRHDCVEGWSAIGKWTGIPLKLLLDAAGLKTQARYIVFHCADKMGFGNPYYESIDLIDAFHPQTILAWALNDEPLMVGNGAPLRLRVERQLGYKQAKYVERIEAVDDLSKVYGGKGGYWEDGAGYEWYAGI